MVISDSKGPHCELDLEDSRTFFSMTCTAHAVYERLLIEHAKVCAKFLCPIYKFTFIDEDASPYKFNFKRLHHSEDIIWTSNSTKL